MDYIRPRLRTNSYIYVVSKLRVSGMYRFDSEPL